MQKNSALIPILKWVGGKRQSLDIILQLVPEKYTTYYEPFVGGGAVFFGLQPHKAVINDVNEELINVYEVIKNNPEDLIDALKKASKQHSEEYFYNVRSADRNMEVYKKLSAVQRAARTIYLNRTCFNGLYRVNAKGEFNVPFGRYKNPNIINEKSILVLNVYFNFADIKIKCSDYHKVLASARKGAFVYLDPPYMPVSETANFTSYTSGGFNLDQQEELKKECDLLNERGIKFLLSNANTPKIREMYANYKITIINAKRTINSNGKKRGDVEEVLVRNYD